MKNPRDLVILDTFISSIYNLNDNYRLPKKYKIMTCEITLIANTVRSFEGGILEYMLFTCLWI